jgi:hypothetical protein
MLAEHDLEKSIRLISGPSERSQADARQVLNMIAQLRAECKKAPSGKLTTKVLVHPGFYAHSEKIDLPEDLPEGIELATIEVWVLEGKQPLHYFLGLMIFARAVDGWKLLEAAALDWRQQDFPPVPPELREETPTAAVKE